MKKNCSIVLALLAGLVLTPLCTCAADLSTPKSAAKSFGEALQNGDAAGVRDASLNGKPELVDGMCNMMKSTKALHDAAVAKFGPDGESLGMGKQADFTKQLENAKVEENGDSATITASDGKPVTLKKADGDWKVDFASMPAMDAALKMLPMMAKMATANQDLADEIEAGKYATAAEAKKAYGQKMMSAFVSHDSGEIIGRRRRCHLHD